MRSFFLSTLAVCACYFPLIACGGLPNTEGVAFTAGETMRLENLTRLGVENVNYIKDTIAAANAIRFKSHFDPRVMAFVGSYGMEFGHVRLNCMGIVLPDSLYASMRPTFDFPSAVKTELTWLSSNGIVDISSAVIAKAGSSLNARRSSGVNGDLQYWTHADSTLFGYNCWYPYDTIANTWADTYECVRSRMSKVQCATVSPGSSLPPQILGTTAVASKSVTGSKRSRSLIVRHLGNGGLIVFLPQTQRSGALVVVTDCKGAVVCSKPVPAGIHSVCINGVAFGRYTARLADY
jgi:hypothetical protein